MLYIIPLVYCAPSTLTGPHKALIQVVHPLLELIENTLLPGLVGRRVIQVECILKQLPVRAARCVLEDLGGGCFRLPIDLQIPPFHSRPLAYSGSGINAKVPTFPRVVIYSLCMTLAILMYGYDYAIVGTVSAMPSFQ